VNCNGNVSPNKYLGLYSKSSFKKSTYFITAHIFFFSSFSDCLLFLLDMTFGTRSKIKIWAGLFLFTPRRNAKCDSKIEHANKALNERFNAKVSFQTILQIFLSIRTAPDCWAVENLGITAARSLTHTQKTFIDEISYSLVGLLTQSKQ